MAVLAPQVNNNISNAQAVEPSVVLQDEQYAMIGQGIGSLIKEVFDRQKKQEASIAPQETEEDYSPPEITPTSNTSGLPIQAQGFLDALASAEGTGGDYRVIVGGKKFESFDQHPNVIGTVTKDGPSTAAGKYQITYQTWTELQQRYPELVDFSPGNQDKAAWYLAVERYKKGSKGRDLLMDLTMGKTGNLREALQKTWTGIIVDKTFERTVENNISAKTTTVLKPVGFTTLKYTNEQAIRNKPVTPELEVKLDVAVSTVLGPGYTVEVFSGGQEKKGQGQRRTGSIRHDVDELGRGLAADVKIYDPSGNQIKDTATLDKVKNFWLTKNYGSVGTYMAGAGMHLDVWTPDKLMPGMASSWEY